MTSTEKTEEIPPQDTRFAFECLRNISEDGKVDIAAVCQALNYTNTCSVANRFRELHKRYGWGSLRCKNVNRPPKEKTSSTADGTPTKRGPSRPTNGTSPKKPRKGAKVSSDTPIPATGPVVKTESSVSEENIEAASEEDGAG